MNQNLFAIFMLFFIPVATIMLNKWRARLTKSKNVHSVAYFIVTSLFSISPLLYIQAKPGEYSGIDVIVVGIVFFWFAIVGGRSLGT